MHSDPGFWGKNGLKPAVFFVLKDRPAFQLQGFLLPCFRVAGPNPTPTHPSQPSPLPIAPRRRRPHQTGEGDHCACRPSTSRPLLRWLQPWRRLSQRDPRHIIFRAIFSKIFSFF